MQAEKPNIRFSDIIKESLDAYLKTFKFQLLYGILYFGLFFLGIKIAIEQLGLTSEIQKLSALMFKNPEAFKNAMDTLGKTEAFGWLAFSMIIIKILLYPLQIGLLHIINNQYLAQESTFQDIIIAYSGSWFFIFISFAMFFGFTEFFLKSFMFFPAYYWIFISIFVGPVMFFNQMPMLNALQYSFRLSMRNFGLVFGSLIIGFIFSWVGLLFFFIGAAATSSFQICVVSTLYRNLALRSNQSPS